MYTIEKIVEMLDRPHLTDDEYNALKADLLSELRIGLDEYSAAITERDRLSDDNARLRENNMSLYNRVERQFSGTTPEEPEEEKEDEVPSPDEIVESNRKLFVGAV